MAESAVASLSAATRWWRARRRAGRGRLGKMDCSEVIRGCDPKTTREALTGHWKPEPYIQTIDLKLNADGSFEMVLFTFDSEEDRLKGDWSAYPGNRLVLTFGESRRHEYGFPLQYVRLVEDVTATSFSLRRIETSFNPLAFARVGTP